MSKKTRYQSAMISEQARNNANEYQKKYTKIRSKQEEGFFNRSVDYRDYLYVPEGYEGFAIGLYLTFIPYIIGLAALFLLVAKANFEYFLEFSLSSFIIIWVIGYEACTILFLVFVVFMWIKYLLNSGKAETPQSKKF